MNPLEVLANHGAKLWAGVQLTLLITGLGALIAGCVAPWLALWKARGGWASRIVLTPYVSMMRGTPLLAQLYLIYYGAGQFREALTAVGWEGFNLWSFFKDPFNCAILTFALNSTAYQTEILRGGVMGVPKGEVEAARAMGMGRFMQLRRVIFPHAYRIAWPALGNEVILLMKASALVSLLTLYDVMGAAKQAYQKTYDFSALLWAALIYLCVTSLFVALWRRTEKRLTRHLPSTSAGGPA